MFDTNEMISRNYLLNKYTNDTIKPKYNNNFKKVFINVNLI